MLDRIRLVLVRTFHPGNIGSAARSAKTMALPPLALVAPKDYPSGQASQMAAGADDLLQASLVYSCVEDAVKGCNLVIAATARSRAYDLPALDARQAAALLVAHSQQSDVALLFGPERMGLHNRDLATAHYRLTIPANPEYSSLNLAAAVQIMCYELFLAEQNLILSDSNQPNEPSTTFPPAEQFSLLRTELEWLLARVRFLRPHQGETLQRIDRFIRKAEPDQSEMNIILGALKAIKRTLET